jgi:hypothetical protein
MPFRFPLHSFIRIVVAGIMTGAFYAGIQYGTPMSGAVAGGQIRPSSSPSGLSPAKPLG